MEFCVNGIDVTVEKKKIKNMYLRVLPPDGKVKITAPMGVAQDAIRAFAASRVAWIERQRQKIADQPKRPQPQYGTGENLGLWGKRYRLAVVSGSPGGVFVGGGQITLQIPEGGTLSQRAGIVDRWRRETLKKALTPLVEACERRVGVRANEWRIRDMRTRWGTCNVLKKRIWFSLQLVEKPPECLEYVVVHELVHLLERSHNDVFWAYMDQFYPDWRRVKAMLNGQAEKRGGE